MHRAPPLFGTTAPTVFRLAAALALLLLPLVAGAVPTFARQTGQNCQACHAGGQFPELTAYGRLFKLTGYTLGSRTLPLSGMAVLSDSRVANTSKSDDPKADFAKNDQLIFATASAFLAGKVTDNVGAFVQITYDNYASQSDDGHFHGHTNIDNVDLRYADRSIDANHDVIWGVSANNNPSVSDVWNTAAAWMQYVPVPSPGSSQFVDGNAPFPGFAAGGNIAGLSAYLFWNQWLYVEAGGYRSASGLASFMAAGVDRADKTKLEGTNPYWRVALSHDWGAHSLMLGTSGMRAKVFDDPLDTSDTSTLHRFRDVGVDAQYQYLLDPHAFTAQLAYAHERQRVPAFLAGQPVTDVDGNVLPDTNAVDRTNVLRAKASYVYDAHYGGAIAFFNANGTSDSALYDPTRVTGNVSAKPAVRGFTYEGFWMPIQYVRLGVQYTRYDKFNGASRNYDGAGRNASDNNTVFFYVWAAY